jgi:hypothetical protein
VNSHLTEDFLSLYRALPKSIREQARQAYQLFANNPRHPGLRFRRVHPSRPIFSARVGIDYRVVGIQDGDDIFWFWIGSHSDYDHLLKQI